MSATLEEPQVELLEQNRQMIEDVATALVTKLMSDAVQSISNIIANSSSKVAETICNADLKQPQGSGEISIARDIHQHFPE